MSIQKNVQNIMSDNFPGDDYASRAEAGIQETLEACDEAPESLSKRSSLRRKSDQQPPCTAGDGILRSRVKFIAPATVS